VVRILGIDPGISGAVGLFTDEVSNVSVVADIPTTEITKDKKFREIEYAMLRDLIWSFRPDHAFIEIVNARPGKDEKTGEDVKFGGTSLFRFGGAFFAIKSIVACLDIPYTMVASSSWKRHFGLEGGKASKEVGRQLVIKQFPLVAPDLKFKYHHQRAEAYLIAAYGAFKRGFDGAPRPVPMPPRTRRPAIKAQPAEARWVEGDDEDIPL